MKIQKKDSSKKIVLTSVIAVILLAIASYALYNAIQDDEADRGQEAADQAGNFVREEDKSLSADDQSTGGNNEEKVLTPGEGFSTDPGTPPEKPNITRAELSGEYIRVSAIFNKSSNGSCKLVFEKTGQDTIEKTAKIIIGPSYYTCDGFRVPVSELPADGQWQIRVIHEQNGKSTSSDKKTVTIN